MQARRRNILSLNHDILSLILAQLRSSDALHLGKTCRAAQCFILPYILSKVVIGRRTPISRTEGQLVGFCAYMLADAARRIPLLKSLTLFYMAFDSKIEPCPRDNAVAESGVVDGLASASSLALVIRQSTRLRELRFEDYAGHVFSEFPMLGDAVAEHTGLDVIRIGHADRQTLKVLSCMKSRPRTVECSIRMRHPNDDYELLIPGEDRFLANFTTSLTTLKLGPCLNMVRLGLGYDIVWPAVENLELGSIPDKFEVNLADVACAFPNIRRLKVLGHIKNPVQSFPVAAGHWRKLDFLSVSRLLPIGRSIRHLWYHTAGTNMDTQAFLRQLSPVVLGCWTEHELIENVAAAAPSVRVLQLFCDIELMGQSRDHILSLTVRTYTSLNQISSPNAEHWIAGQTAAP